MMRWTAVLLLPVFALLAVACEEEEAGPAPSPTVVAEVAETPAAQVPTEMPATPVPPTNTPVPVEPTEPPPPPPTNTPVPPPPPLPPTEPPPQAQNCHPSYEGACLDPNCSDYDCAGGSGDGPCYTGRVKVVGPDVFRLDRDGDGWGCE